MDMPHAVVPHFQHAADIMYKKPPTFDELHKYKHCDYMFSEPKDKSGMSCD